MNLEWAKKKIVSMAERMLSKPLTLTDRVAKGYLSIRKEYADGRTEDILKDDPNVIMYDARRSHLSFLYDETASPDILTSFKVGSGGAIGSDTAGNTNIKVIEPDPSRSDLYNPILLTNNSIQTDAPYVEDEVYLQVTFTLSQDEGNGLFINECGLFKDSGVIFNHKTFASIPKNESFSLIFDWKIRYV